MKSKSLNKAGNFIMLSGEIDKSYMIEPGVKITFGERSTFEGIKVAKDTTFCNNSEYIVKHFTLNSLGQIELTPIPGSSDQRHEAQEPHPQGAKKSLALIIPSSCHPSAFEEDSLLELGLTEESMRQRPISPTPEKEPCNDKSPSNNSFISPPERASSITPTLEELSTYRNQSTQEEPSDPPPLSGENAKEEAGCDCCIIV